MWPFDEGDVLNRKKDGRTKSGFAKPKEPAAPASPPEAPKSPVNPMGNMNARDMMRKIDEEEKKGR